MQHKCEICNKETNELHTYSIDGDFKEICEECESGLSSCDDCHEYTLSEQVYADGEHKSVCTHCLDAFYTTCEDCGEIIYKYNTEDIGHKVICNDCKWCYYEMCDECNKYELGGKVNHFNNTVLCSDCVPIESLGCGSASVETSYNHEDIKTITLESGDTVVDFPIGNEIELEKSSSWEQYHASLSANNIAKRYDRNVDFVHDESVEFGIEIVTSPFTYNQYNDFLYDDETIELFRYFTPECTCGLHMHVGLEHFDDKYQVITNMLSYISKFQYEFEMLSERENDEFCEIYDFSAKDCQDDITNYIHFVENDSRVCWTNGSRKLLASKTTCVNLTEHKTLEFRLFASSNDPQVLLYRRIVFLALINVIGVHGRDLEWNEFIEVINEIGSKIDG